MSPPYPKVLVCWSGGCDSTLLLHHAARLYGTERSPIRTFSLTCDQISSGPPEAKARQRILKALRRRGYNIEHTEMTLSTGDGPGLRHHGLPQAVLWLVATQALTVHETLALGYIRGDDWLGDAEGFRAVFDRLQKINGREGVLWTPLAGTEKCGVLHQLRELDLLDLTWWCELPAKRKPCGECPSCQRHATGLWKLKRFGPGHYWQGNEDGS